MAIQIKNTYSGRTDNTDPNYPYGKGRNVVGGVEGTGTPFEAAWYNNLEGFLQGLLLEAEVTPDGEVDNANSSQLVEAVKGLEKSADKVITSDGRDVQERLDDLPSEVDAAGTAATLIEDHNSDAGAHPELSAFITSEADRAEVAASAATSSGNVYADTTAGLAATVDGDYFSVVSPDVNGYLDLYKNNAGVAEFKKQYPSTEKVNYIEYKNYLDGFKNIRRYTKSNLSKRSVIVILLGQSLNAARLNIVKDKCQTGAYMMNGGVHVSAFSNWSFNKDSAMGGSGLVSSTTLVEGGEGQSPCVGVASTVIGDNFSRCYAASAAIGSRTIDMLRDRGSKANLQALCERMVRLSRTDGYEPVIAFYSAHGEADANASTSEQDYFDKASQYYQLAQAMASQSLGDPNFLAPVFLTMPVQTGGESYGDIAVKRAINKMSDNLDGIFNLGGVYQWPIESDRTHPTAEGAVARGEYVGDVIRDYFTRQNAVNAPRAVDLTYSGTTFTLVFDKSVERDVTNIAGTNLNTANALDGIEWFDSNANNYIKINSLNYSGRVITGELASTPTGVESDNEVRIAMQRTTAALQTGAENHTGSQVVSINYKSYSIIDNTYESKNFVRPQSINARAL